MLIKKLKKIIKLKDILCSWIGKINIIKMFKLPKDVYKSNAIPINIPMALFTEIEQINLKFVWNMNRQSNNEKEEQNSRYHVPDFELYYKSTVIKTMWY